MTADEWVQHCRALAAIYAEAAKQLRVAELRAFLIHEVTVLNNAQAVGEPVELMQVHVKQAREYLDSILALRPGKRPSGSLHVLMGFAIVLAAGWGRELVDLIDRLT